MNSRLAISLCLMFATSAPYAAPASAPSAPTSRWEVVWVTQEAGTPAANASTPPAPVAIAPTLPPVPDEAPAPPVPAEWILDPAKTLRDNLTNWATTAGWRLLWLAADPYEVGPSKPLTGVFPGVLSTFSDITGLNICAHKYARRVVVTDSHISCKESQ